MAEEMDTDDELPVGEPFAPPIVDRLPVGITVAVDLVRTRLVEGRIETGMAVIAAVDLPRPVRVVGHDLDEIDQRGEAEPIEILPVGIGPRQGHGDEGPGIGLLEGLPELAHKGDEIRHIRRPGKFPIDIDPVVAVIVHQPDQILHTGRLHHGVPRHRGKLPPAVRPAQAEQHLHSRRMRGLGELAAGKVAPGANRPLVQGREGMDEMGERGKVDLGDGQIAAPGRIIADDNVR